MSERLEVGRDYVCAGPHPRVVRILEITDTGYRTEGDKQIAPVIHFGCEPLWRPLEAAERLQDVPWWQRRMLAYDCETTGVYVEEDRIVSAAIAVVGGGQPTETLELLADPGIEIPDSAAEVHGITTEKARADGQPAREVVATILDTLRGHLQAGAPLIVFNARFDLTVLDREAKRHGLQPLEVGRCVVDPVVIDKWLDRYRKSMLWGEDGPSSRTLEGMARVYDAKLDMAHDATFDAIAAGRIAYRIGQRGQVVRRVCNGSDAYEKKQLVAEWDRVRTDLGLLHDAQRSWALEERFRFADYKRSQGEHDIAACIDSERGWPVLEPGVLAQVAA